MASTQITQILSGEKHCFSVCSYLKTCTEGQGQSFRPSNTFCIGPSLMTSTTAMLTDRVLSSMTAV